MNPSFAGKVAIVTGGTAGIGEATALRFAREGAQVVVWARNEARGKEMEKKAAAEGLAITFDKVLAILDGDKATFGTPVVEGASVEGKIVKNGKGKKIRIFKYNAKKGYRKRQGHRQPYTKVEIGKISV